MSEMKYIIQMTQIIERTVIVDADSDEEADKKLLAEKIEKEWKRIQSDHSYGDWTYEGFYKVKSSDDLITCADDIAKLYGCNDVSTLDRALFKYTDCGMCAHWDEDKITLIGYVEGCDAEHPNETLYFPFTVERFRAVRNALGKIANEMWHKWNDKE